jgi:myosin heavy subunit
MNSNRVWVKIKNDWLEGELISEHLVDKTHIILINNETYEFSNYEKHNNMENLKKNNLVDIPHLNEPSVLQAIHLRYEEDVIYTYTGKILISINPFKDLNLFTDENINKYKNNSKNLEPHLYQIADAAYKNLLKFNKNQTILVSGESGAGKTYSTRCIIKYLTNLSKNKSDIENMVVQSNPILESFGNAKTLRNDNSSRFGKFIKIQIQNYSIIGCNIETYLLEKIRLIQQENDERNFHIFYQLLNSKIKTKYFLKNFEDYNFLNNRYIKCCDVDDKEDFDKLMTAFEIMGFKQDIVDKILSIVSSILHLGNIIITDDGNITDTEELLHVSNLLDISKNILIESMSYRFIKTSDEIIKIKLDKENTIKSRNSLAMKLYDNTFKFIVNFINENLKCGCESFIGILDIFGFESFDNNFFEQFCINYTNESLQEQFNNYIFKLEQKEYEMEGIDWSHITFPDNKGCLDLIEGRGGILKILDEECKLSRGTDKGFTNKLFKKHETNDYLKKNKKYASERFIISHYAGNVEYNTDGFRSKNLDHVSETILELLNSIYITQSDMEVSSRINAKSLAIQFKNQLHILMESIEDTSPYYIRCIKPNDKNVCELFDRIRVNQQIKYSGVLSAIKVSRAGYPIRFLKNDFTKRYNIIKKFYLDESLFLKENMENDSYETGKTKIFLKNNAYDFLEDERNNAINDSVITIQAYWRRYFIQKTYKFILSKIIKLQSFCRMYLATKELIFLRYTKAAIIIQKNRRKSMYQSKYKNILQNIIKLQIWYKKSKFEYKIRCILKIQEFYRAQSQRIFMKNKLEQQRNWEAMTSTWEVQEEKRKQDDENRLKELEKEHKLKIKKLEEEEEAFYKRLKKEEVERKELENKIRLSQIEKEKTIERRSKALEEKTKQLAEDNNRFKYNIQRDVERKMKMASQMEKLIIQNRRMQMQMQQMVEKRNYQKNCIIS